MREIYLVRGNTGRYSDYTEWVVAAYLDKDQAFVHLAALKKKVSEAKMTPEEANTSKGESWNAHYKRAKKVGDEIKATLDPNVADTPYDGLEYGIEVRTLYDHFDEFQEQHNKDLIQENKE
jgi:hypothetical protein